MESPSTKLFAVHDPHGCESSGEIPQEADTWSARNATRKAASVVGWVAVGMVVEERRDCGWGGGGRAAP